MAEMSGVVQQASHKVVALEQLVSVLRTQVKLAERRAVDAEVLKTALFILMCMVNAFQL